jgi:hypothetical protein
VAVAGVVAVTVAGVVAVTVACREQMSLDLGLLVLLVLVLVLVLLLDLLDLVVGHFQISSPSRVPTDLANKTVRTPEIFHPALQVCKVP